MTILKALPELNTYQRNNYATKQVNKQQQNKTKPTKQTKTLKPSNHLGSDTNKQPGSSETVIE